jgi:hypothetical protein
MRASPRFGVRNFIEEQLAPEKLEDRLCDRVIRHEFDEFDEPEARFFRRPGDHNDPLQQLFPALKDRGARVGDLFEYKEKILLNDLTRATILRAVLSRRQLREVLVNFWTDHFNIDPSKGDCKWLKPADDRDVIRAHALGNFRDMLRASAVSPAMLWYLDGRVNQRKRPEDKPNENYARELMELHTLGVHGGYTQHDVMEVARCLTGWTVREKNRFFKGRVEFHPKSMTTGRNVSLGVEIPAGLGARDLDRVLEIIALHPNTAKYLAWKLCRRFIADEPPETAVTTIAEAFLQAKGDIRATLRALFTSPEFLAPAVRAAKFKRPLHFVVSALRASNAETDGASPLVDYLLRLGHAPFRYPTPDGYPEEASHWQSTLLVAMEFRRSLRGESDQREPGGFSPTCAGGSATMTPSWRHFSGAPRRKTSGGHTTNRAPVSRCLSRRRHSNVAKMNATEAVITGNGDLKETLIVVFLRGGADGLALVAPLEDDNYYKARPRIGIERKDAVKLDGFFRTASAACGAGTSLRRWRPGHRPWCRVRRPDALSL